MNENLLIIHGGGPTAVINASLYGAVMEAKKHPEIGHIYAAKNGTGGLMKGELIELEKVPAEELELLLQTPGSAIGTSRDALEEAEYLQITKILKEKNIRYVLMNGGNGTMDTCGKLYHACQAQGMDVRVMGIPKTMDNDLAITDHSPGFGSAALYMAQSTAELCADVKGLPIHVVVLEASGRNAGWITASSALAADQGGDGPDLIYLPERPFDEDQFIEDVSELLKKKKGIVVVASEGLHDKEGKPIVEPIFKTGRATYFGDVGTHLAGVVIRRLGYKARGEKPGLLGRCSICMQSPVDREEARLAGEIACREVLKGTTGKMVAFRRVENAAASESGGASREASHGDLYSAEPFLVDIEEVMLHERKMPEEFINEQGNGVTEAFKEWCRPLLGQEIRKMTSFN